MKMQKLPPEYSKQADKYLSGLDAKGVIMDLALEIKELSSYLDDDKKRLVLEFIKSFLQDDEVGPDDLHYIKQAREEYARGETISHNDRNWK